MTKAVYPGSFGPVTFGHSPLFSLDERVRFLEEVTK